MKYNDNGEWKDIYVKTLDSLPTGAIVDYDGDTLPDGWVEYNNEVVLFSSSSGTTSNFTLSDNPRNYKYIEITFVDTYNNNHGVRKIDMSSVPNRIVLDCNSINYDSGSGNIYMEDFVTIYTLSGNSFNVTQYGAGYKQFTFNNSGALTNTKCSVITNSLKVLKVVGYK